MVKAASIDGRSVLPPRWNPVKATTVARLLTLAARLSVPSWAATVLALLVMPTCLAAQSSPWETVVHLAQHTSPSGTYVLEVDPTTRYGAGSAHYRLLRDREAVWEREHPFTFAGASVGDDGVVAGWGCTEGVGQYDYGELVFAVLAPDGTVRGELRGDRVGSRRPHVKPVPTPLRVLIQPQGDMALLLVVEEEVVEKTGFPRRYESWWRMRLSDGTPLDPIDDEEGRWQVHELGTETYSQPTTTDDWPTTLNGTSFEPTILGEVQFDLTEDNQPTPADTEEPPLIGPEDQFVDSLGNIYLLDCRTSLLHSFTATGTRRWLVLLPPNAFEKTVYVDGLAVRGDGHVLLWSRFKPQRAEVDGEGHVLSPLPKPIDEEPAAPPSLAELFPGRMSEVAFVPGSGRHWVLINYTLELRDAAGRVQTRVERAPDGRWLCVNDALRAAADGSVACIDHVLQGDAELHRVHIIEQDGSVRRTVTLSGARRSYPFFAYDGRHLVVRDGDSLLVVDVDTGERQLATLEESHGWNPFLSPSGDEIWLFPFRSARITRIAMP